MKYISLVALYGAKPSPFASFVKRSQSRIVDLLGTLFQPYNLHQIHATITSLQQVLESQYWNSNLFRYRNKKEPMDFAGLLHFLRHGNYFPFHIRIGGFKPLEHPFLSQDKTPYERSFSLQGDKAVMMGWPVYWDGQSIPSQLDILPKDIAYPPVLEEIRHAFQSFDILHSYHLKETDIDNDFYFRIGLIRQDVLDDSLRERVQTVLRNTLSEEEPLILKISRADIFLVVSETETFSPSVTRAWSVVDPQVTPEFIKSLYT